MANSTYIMIKKVKPCKEEYKKTCLFNMINKGDCKKALYHCQYSMRNNPLCTCKNINNCPREWIIEEYKGDTYILYRCKTCSFFIKDFEKTGKKLLEKIGDDSIIIGEKKDKLLKKIIGNQDESKHYNNAVKYFESIYKSINRRV
jgi:hypothetical protein